MTGLGLVFFGVMIWLRVMLSLRVQRSNLVGPRLIRRLPRHCVPRNDGAGFDVFRNTDVAVGYVVIASATKQSG